MFLGAHLYLNLKLKRYAAAIKEGVTFLQKYAPPFPVHLLVPALRSNKARPVIRVLESLSSNSNQESKPHLLRQRV